MAYTYDYPRPMVTIDCVVFTKDENGRIQVLLIQRDHEPFEEQWAFPGGYVNMEETLEAAAQRELQEETGLKNIPLVQLHTFSDPKRDPRGRTISTAFFGFVNKEDHPLNPSSDARAARWFSISQVPKLAFDHQAILDRAMAFYKNYEISNIQDSQ